MRLLPRWRVQPSALATVLVSLLLAGPALAQDRLPSWNDGQRIAVFDNDGTLWTEQPMYVQLAFALDRVKALAPQHPEWKDTQPFKAVLED